MMRFAPFAGLALAAVLLAACAPAVPRAAAPPAESSAAADPSSPPPSSSEALATPSRDAAAPAAAFALNAAPRVVTEKLVAPWSIAFHGDSALVSERDTARILEVQRDGDVREAALIPGVLHEGEGGLLGLAVREGFLYVYSTGSGENRIERYPMTGEPGALGVGQPEKILDGIPASHNHNGGRIAFGPDGMLYATAGDAGEGGLARDLGSLGGKILRMTPDGEVPEDNPFPGSLVYSYGHRNPQGIAWADDGTMYASEFGQETWDELNVITPGGDYGWDEEEGIAERDGMIDPILQWPPSEASPSGIAIVGGTLYMANLRGARLRAVPLADPDAAVDHLVSEVGRIRDVALAPDGDLWILTNNTDGRGAAGEDDDRILAFAPE
ncbi:PQQ-dependent sugar dehydrogenase [Microbacterium oryzae]|nr:PQQ-dependent sugar dehydrogenase [Microbacterium oryzae]